MKKILFMVKCLQCGGVETTLLNLLKKADYENVSVDLYLLTKRGVFLEQVPKQVNVYEVEMPERFRDLVEYYGLTKLGIQHYWRKKCYARILWLLVGRLWLKFVGIGRYQKWIVRHFSINKNDYDIVCDYQGYVSPCTTFLSQYRGNGTKCTWLHDETIFVKDIIAQNFLTKFDYVFGVSEECIINYKKKFPYTKAQNVEVLHNTVVKEELQKKAKQRPSVYYENLTIVSVGRLVPQKGFDLAIAAASLLSERGLKFQWVIIGDGPERANLIDMIHEKHLENEVILHGFDSNPYSYMNQAKLYVQSSRHEGFVTTITEALFLGKAIVSTKFSGVYEQVVPDYNGILVNFDAVELADAIELLLTDEEKRINYSKNSLQMELCKENPWERLMELAN